MSTLHEISQHEALRPYLRHLSFLSSFIESRDSFKEFYQLQKPDLELDLPVPESDVAIHEMLKADEEIFIGMNFTPCSHRHSIT